MSDIGEAGHGDADDKDDDGHSDADDGISDDDDDGDGGPTSTTELSVRKMLRRHNCAFGWFTKFFRQEYSLTSVISHKLLIGCLSIILFYFISQLQKNVPVAFA